MYQLLRDVSLAIEYVQHKEDEIHLNLKIIVQF